MICLTMAWISDVISEAGFSGGRLQAGLRLHQNVCSPVLISQTEMLQCQARVLGLLPLQDVALAPPHRHIVL